MTIASHKASYAKIVSSPLPHKGEMKGKFLRSAVFLLAVLLFSLPSGPVLSQGPAQDKPGTYVEARGRLKHVAFKKPDRQSGIILDSKNGMLSLQGRTEGTFVSQIFDAGADAFWKEFSLLTTPHGALPNTAGKKHEFIDDATNMRGNVVLLHFDRPLSNLPLHNPTATITQAVCPKSVVRMPRKDLTAEIERRLTPETLTAVSPACPTIAEHGRFGSALRLRSENRALQLSGKTRSSHISTPALTVSAWLRVKKSTRGLDVVKQHVSGKGSGWALRVTDGVAEFVVGGNAQRDDRVVAKGKTKLGTFDGWVHVVGVWDGRNGRLFINGMAEEQAVASGQRSLTYNSANIRIADTHGPGSFEGLVDEIAIWTRALSSKEVLSHYRRGIIGLEITVRGCDDARCVGERFKRVGKRSGRGFAVPHHRYLQYRVAFRSEQRDLSVHLHSAFITSGGVLKHSPAGCAPEISPEAELTARDGGANHRFGREVAISDDWLIVGAPFDKEPENIANHDGAVYFYQWDNEEAEWLQKQKILPLHEVPGPRFLGMDVAIEGDIAVAGAGWHSYMVGEVYVYRRYDTGWQLEARLTPPDGAPNKGFNFGGHVAINQGVIAVGAASGTGNAEGAGAVYVFRWDGSSWTNNVQKVWASDGQPEDHFGRSVGISGDLLVVGAPMKKIDNESIGAVYTYAWNGTEWSEVESFFAEEALQDPTSWHSFGYSVAISGGALVVGTPFHHNIDTSVPFPTQSGAVYVYRWNGTGWLRTQTLHPSDDTIYNTFYGSSVAITGSMIVVGAPYYYEDWSSRWGAAYVYQWDGTAWGAEQRLELAAPADSDAYGFDVAASDRRVIVSALKRDTLAEDAGAAYVYTVPLIENIERDGVSTADFGWSIAIDGDTAAVGLHTETDFGPHSGAVQVYRCDPSGWQPEARLTASDGSAFDHFGSSATAVSGDVLVVGARGSSMDAGAAKPGAAYVFRRNGTAWSQEAKLTNSGNAADDSFGTAVAISGNVIVVGDIGGAENYGGSGEGKVVVFRWNGSSWIEEAALSANDDARSFGQSVAIHKDLLVVGNRGTSDSPGKVHVYEYNGSTWVELDPLFASVNPDANDFGMSVSVHQNRIAVGDLGGGDEPGSAYIFQRNGNQWSEEARFTTPDEIPQGFDDAYAASVWLFGDRVLVGDYVALDDSGIHTGAAYLYHHDNNGWSLEKSFRPSDGTSFGIFGVVVALSGDQVLVQSLNGPVYFYDLTLLGL